VTTDPHHNEYLAAAAALCEQTPPPEVLPTFAVGDFVSGTTAGRRWQGRVEWQEGRMLTIDVGGGWVRVPVADVTH
jgi:hypothetical protein